VIEDRPVIIIDTSEASGSGRGGGANIYKSLLEFEEKGVIQVRKENLGDAIDYAIPTIDGGWHLIQRKTASEMINPFKHMKT